MLPTLESVRRVTRTVDGEITATSMLERFGFTGDRLTTRIGDLSGGERRRFQLLRLLLTEPNVLLLDEPTNDLDIETLNVLEDFLDGWPGTLVVVSHDRYFLERVTDSVWALLGDGQISMLPRRRRRVPRSAAPPQLARPPYPPRLRPPPTPARRGQKARPGSAEERAARKTLARLDKQLERLAEQEAAAERRIVEAGQDYERLAELAAELDALAAQRDAARVRVAGGRRAAGVSRPLVEEGRQARHETSAPDVGPLTRSSGQALRAFLNQRCGFVAPGLDDAGVGDVRRGSRASAYSSSTRRSTSSSVATSCRSAIALMFSSVRAGSTFTSPSRAGGLYDRWLDALEAGVEQQQRQTDCRCTGSPPLSTAVCA